MPREKMTQNDKVLKHLRAGYSISPLEALGLFGVYRLAARILELRTRLIAEGDTHRIITEDRTDGQGRSYARYHLVPRSDARPERGHFTGHDSASVQYAA